MAVVTKAKDAISLIKRFEGAVKDKKGNHVAYRDQVGVWTIGYGSTYIDGRPVKEGDVITEEKAVALLEVRVNQDRARIVENLGYTPKENELSALLSFAYNVGISGLLNSALYRYVKAGQKAAAADQFLLWKYGTVNGVKKVLPGLLARRKEERRIYLS